MSSPPNRPRLPRCVTVNGVQYFLNNRPLIQRVVDVRPRGNIPTVIRLPLVAKPFYQNHQTASMSVLNHKLPMSSTASQSTSSLEEIPKVVAPQQLMMSKLPTSVLMPTPLSNSLTVKETPSSNSMQLLNHAVPSPMKDLSKTVVDLTDEPTQSSQSKATKTSQRWEDKEILMLLSCYEKFLPRFRKKREPEKRIWGEVSEMMNSNGVSVTGERCVAKWKSLRERYNTFNEKLLKEGSGRKSLWPYFERMNAILGFDDTVRLQYVHEVGAVQKPKLPSEGLKRPLEENVSSASTFKKTKSRINTGETLNRLTELEAERNDRDKEFLETWKSQSESNAAKNNAIIAASQAIGQVSLAILERLKRQDTASSTVSSTRLSLLD